MKIIAFKFNMALLASFIIGFLLGSVLINLLIGNQVDRLYYANKELELKLENTSAELDETKANLSKSKGIIVTSISPKVELPPELSKNQDADKVVLTLNKEIIKYYKPLIGVPVKSLEPELIPQIAEGRIVVIEQERYRLAVKTVVLSETLFIEINVNVLN